MARWLPLKSLGSLGFRRHYHGSLLAERRVAWQTAVMGSDPFQHLSPRELRLAARRARPFGGYGRPRCIWSALNSTELEMGLANAWSLLLTRQSNSRDEVEKHSQIERREKKKMKMEKRIRPLSQRHRAPLPLLRGPDAPSTHKISLRRAQIRT